MKAAALDVDLIDPLVGGYKLQQLMELAGLSVAQAVWRVSPKSGVGNGRVVVFAGPGNNGGDGMVAARHLRMFGFGEVVLVLPVLGNKNELFFEALIKQCEGKNSLSIQIGLECFAFAVSLFL